MTGQIANRYILQDIIGTGGNGVVYRALDTLTDTVVAIKQLRPEQLDTTPTLLERFRREGEALRELNHPNIVKMLDMVEEQGSQFLVEEYIAGGDLTQLIKQEPLPVDRTIALALELADALTRAHHLNIIHRDLKPGNVLIAADGTPRLTDFGVALIGNKQRMTDKGIPVGTVEYLSPEALTADVDNRADIWAFGVMLFEMLTAQRPFQGKSLSEIVGKIMMSPIPDIEQLRHGIPLPLVDLIYRMLEKDRNARISSVRLVGAELEAIQQGTVLNKQNVPIASGMVIASRFDNLPITDSATQHNLPARSRAFIGREYEIDEIVRLIHNPETRLITIQGPGGIGKTHLALEVANRMLESFHNRVFFIDLVPLREPEHIVTGIAEAMHFKFLQDERHSGKQLLDYLAKKKVLLVLDNFEHLMNDTTIVRDILDTAPDVTILITSRQRLNHSGESVVLLHGMEFPEDSTLETALNFSAVKLFIQNARRVRPEFMLLPKDVSQVARICRLVDGLPLGIVLAASWIELLSIEEIADEIEQSADFLATDMSDIPERHRSMRAVFNYSWQLLNPSEQAIFMKLAVFRGGFTREAAIEVVAANLHMMMALMNKSLLYRHPDSGRYTIHDLLREYAKEKLVTSNLEKSVRETHMHYYTQLAQKYGQQLYGGAQLRAMEVLDAELDNIRSAWQYAIEQQAAEALARMQPMWLFYDILGLWSEAIHMVDKSLDAIGHAENEAVGDLLTMGGICAYRAGQIDKAYDYNLRAIEIFEKLDNEHNVLLPRINQANVMLIKGQMDDMFAAYHELAEQAHQLGHRWEESTVYLNMGYAFTFLEDLDAAEQATQRALEITQSHDDMLASGAALHNLGDITYRKGDPKAAKDLLTESLSVALMFDNILLIYLNLIFLCKASIEMDDLPAAADYAYRSADIAEENSLQFWMHDSMVATVNCLQEDASKSRSAIGRLLNRVLDDDTEFKQEPEMLEAVPLYLHGVNRTWEASRWLATLLDKGISDIPVRYRLQALTEQFGDAPILEDIDTAIRMTLGIVNEPDTI